MYFTNSHRFKERYNRKDKKYLLATAQKMLPGYVFDNAKLEGDPMTFPEVKALLDGITVGGHKLTDEKQILNLKKSWDLLIGYVATSKFDLSEWVMNSINSKVAEEEALEWGSFRKGPVFIAGTKRYEWPPAGQLPEIFATDVKTINAIENPVERAVAFFLWGSLNQFYYDGNKRTARLMANGVLLGECLGVFNTPASLVLTYNTLVTEFYDTRDATRISGFFEETSIVTFD